MGISSLVTGVGIEPTRLAAGDFEPRASIAEGLYRNFACLFVIKNR